ATPPPRCSQELATAGPPDPTVSATVSRIHWPERPGDCLNERGARSALSRTHAAAQDTAHRRCGARSPQGRQPYLEGPFRNNSCRPFTVDCPPIDKTSRQFRLAF